MIDLLKAQKAFQKYISHYDSTIPSIRLKIIHTYKVIECSEYLCHKLHLSKEDSDLASLIALLHDIGRFEQWMRYQSFADHKTIDHALFSSQLLFDEGLIREFIEDDQYDDIIKHAIEQHNRYQVEDGFDEKTLLFIHLIRDADKVDIFYEVCMAFPKNKKEEIENSKISSYIEKEIKEKKTIKREKGKRIDGIDNVLSTIAFVFDLNYKESFKILKKEDYINKIFNQFDFKFDETKEKVKELKKLTSDYIEEKIHNE